MDASIKFPNRLMSLSEWLRSSVYRKQLLNSVGESFPLKNALVEVFWHDIQSFEPLWTHLDQQGVKIGNLICQMPIFNGKSSKQEFLGPLTFAKKFKIPHITVQDSTGYPGDSEPLRTRLSSRVMSEHQWAEFQRTYEEWGEVAQQCGCQLLLGNRTGMIIETMKDFEKISTGKNYGFFMDGPHFLHGGESLFDMPVQVTAKIQGVRLGSHNPCAWVATRQNKLSWNECLNFNVFQPFTLVHKAMLGKQIGLVKSLSGQLKTISLACDSLSDSIDPLSQFQIGEMTFCEVFLTKDLASKKSA